MKQTITYDRNTKVELAHNLVMKGIDYLKSITGALLDLLTECMESLYILRVSRISLTISWFYVVLLRPANEGWLLTILSISHGLHTFVKTTNLFWVN